jgi:hypothetical protein
MGHPADVIDPMSQKRDMGHPADVIDPRSQRRDMGHPVSHPSDIDRDVARVGHPHFWLDGGAISSFWALMRSMEGGCGLRLVWRTQRGR